MVMMMMMGTGMEAGSSKNRSGDGAQKRGGKKRGFPLDSVLAFLSVAPSNMKVDASLIP